MTPLVQYETEGFCFLPDSTIDPKFIKTAQKGMLAVRDGIFDTSLPPRHIRVTITVNCARLTMHIWLTVLFILCLSNLH